MTLYKRLKHFTIRISRPTGVVDRGADCYTKGTGFESRVRHGYKTVCPFIGGKGDHLTGDPLIKWSPRLALIVAKVCDLRVRHSKKKVYHYTRSNINILKLCSYNWHFIC